MCSIAKPTQPWIAPCGRNYMVMQSCRVFAFGEWIELEEGEISDGASAPVFTLNLLGLSRFDPRLILAAFFHDKAYRLGILSKEDADLLFYNLLIQGGIGRKRANILYQSVKKFGHKHYKG